MHTSNHVSHDVRQTDLIALEPDNFDSRKILINVSGQQFVSTFGTLSKYPNTKLGKCASQQQNTTSYFFESDAEIFKEVLKFYRTDELHCPKNICFSDFKTHLDFWEVDSTNISDCCSRELKDESELEMLFQYFNKRIEVNCEQLSRRKRFFYLVWCFLTDPFGIDTKWKTGAKLWAIGYLLFTIFTGTVLSTATIPSLWNASEINATAAVEMARQQARIFDRNMTCNSYAQRILSEAHGFLITFCAAVYAIEIWIRFFVCPNKLLFWKSVNGVDMVISLFEVVSSVLTFVADYAVIPHADSIHQSSMICASAHSIQLMSFGVAQMRYLRLFSYASVYR